MVLIFNELSCYPIANTNIEAEKRFNQLLKCFKAANIIFGFKAISFHQNFADQNITADMTFYEWLSTVSNSTLKNGILSFYRKPYADDLNDNELASFLESDYIVVHDDVPTHQNPTGLPIAHIKSTLALSFNSDLFWQKRKISILKTNISNTEDIEFAVYNICFEADLKEKEIIEWSNKVLPNTIDSKEKLIKYLAFSKYTVLATNTFMAELLNWKENNEKIFKYILLLMKDVEIHPFTGGMGQTENLKYKGKENSKRITNTYPDGDRLSYFLENDTVTFVACKGHYKFH